ncbi:hypothetical protein N7474_003149 [Penicillium riverlandense]|uniref:uncharacterized protein n=1 Tax=Penicillium riverlandense TaxID=1903569 RepID=UPI002549674B|nr:uncharacterized protein N7474_003149 [Penicillium riverlandense]KAJ5826011.1 hypothetical protein N7474_003149 [Penicillium riverlandense]
MTSGSCACNYIRYVASAPPSCLVNCHCTTCRKQAGAPYQTWAMFSTNSVQWHVKPTEWRSSNSATRSFCPRCGSTLSMVLDSSPNEVGVAAGTIDDHGQLPQPSDHIFLQDKASWFEVPESDRAKRWDEWDHNDNM